MALQNPKPYTHSIPLADPTVTLIFVDDDGNVQFANTRNDKMDALLDAFVDSKFYAVWPGQFSSHLFKVDRREGLKQLAAAGR